MSLSKHTAFAFNLVMKIISLFLLSSFLLFSCTSATQTPVQIVTVYATSATEPWLRELFTCAEDLSVVLKVGAEAPEIYLRLGEPEMNITPAYQIDEEEILIVVHQENAIQKLTLAEAQELFAHEDPSMQVWVYASDADLQIMFDQLAMRGRSVTSSARVAGSPQKMFDVLNSESTVIGILPRHWMTGNTLRAAASIGKVPVLALTKSEPQAIVVELISCLQGN